ncbi:hypothetical protein [Helicobacter pylori]|uniref:hypothetical protein n=1 Tax=Helicobacter pylori TaxID=210 RepID=UPI003F92C8D9
MSYYIDFQARNFEHQPLVQLDPKEIKTQILEREFSNPNAFNHNQPKPKLKIKEKTRSKKQNKQRIQV